MLLPAQESLMNNEYPPKHTTREDVEKLARDNPIIFSALNAMYSGHISFEQAMLEAVKLLAKHNAYLEQTVLKHALVLEPVSVPLQESSDENKGN